MGGPEGLVFGDVVLDSTCLFAHRNGKQIRFTRSERALLLALSRNPHRLMQRSQLLDAVGPAHAEASDRNVDFLINRLRAKLGDSARAPRYIATQYGEGYVWIATQSPPSGPKPERAPAEGFLAIVPALAGGDGRADERAEAIAGQLCGQILSRLEAGRMGVGHAGRAVCVLGSEAASAKQAMRYVLALSFQDSGLRFDCAAILREMPSRRIVKAFRLGGAGGMAGLGPEIARVAEGVVEALEGLLSDASVGLGTPLDQPLDIRLRTATTLLSAANPRWLEKGQQLHAARLADPGSADIALQWGLHLFSRLVAANPFAHVSRGERDEIEGEIEATALDCLPRIEANPLLMLAAAKLLYFVDRGHLALAHDLAERAFARTADFAAALPILGQLRQARGEYGAALAFLDRGIEMADAGSEFLLHMRVLKCIALLAAGQREALADAAAFAGEKEHAPPDIAMLVSVLVTPPDQPLPSAISGVLAAAGPDAARNAVEWVYMTSARHLTSLPARANIMQGFITHVSQLHGRDAIPPLVLIGTGLMAAG
ncbi:winged helix-turn-helix domain-containing protein [Xanthobacteraceae bacterium A53D]